MTRRRRSGESPGPPTARSLRTRSPEARDGWRAPHTKRGRAPGARQPRAPCALLQSRSEPLGRRSARLGDAYIVVVVVVDVVVVVEADVLVVVMLVVVVVDVLDVVLVLELDVVEV